jgi:ornithine carbamoyltransferase
MAFNLHNRSFLKLLDFTPREIRFLLDLSRDLKRAKYGGYEQQHMRARTSRSSSRRPPREPGCRSRSRRTTRAPT